MGKRDLGITLRAAYRKLKSRNKGKAVYVFPIPREGVLSGTSWSPWKRSSPAGTGKHDLGL